MRRRSFGCLRISAAFCATALFAQSNDANVFVYRPREQAGLARRMTLSLDGQRLAYLQNGRYLALYLTPGEHQISDKNPDNVLTFKVEPSAVYYIRCEWKQTGPAGLSFNARLSMPSPETGSADMRPLKPGDRKQIQNVSVMVNK